MLLSRENRAETFVGFLAMVEVNNIFPTTFQCYTLKHLHSNAHFHINK